jgi:hypothetical protein
MPCNIDTYDGSQPDFFVSKNIISRREHRCCECYATIPAKTKYQHITGKWDGDILRYKSCMICAELRRILFDNQIYYTELWDNLSDCLDDLTIKDIDKLSVEAICKLEKRLSYKFDDDDEEEND